MSAIETSVSPILSSLSTGTTSTNNVNTNTLNNAKDKSSLSSQIAQNASHITSTSSNSSSPSTHNNSSSLSAASYNNIGNSSSNSTLSSSPKDISNHRNNVSNQSSPEAQCGVNNYSSASLYVGDLHNDVSEAMLYDVFNSVGPVASIRVCRDATSRKSLGYAYVNYHLPSDAERALDTLNYTLIKGIAVRIMWSQRDPALRKSGTGNVFVKNLDKTIDNKALYDTFSLFGNILSCKVKNDEAGRSLGFGFVHYESDEAAQNAIDRVNGMLIGGKTVFVGRFLKKSQRGGLNSTVQDTPKFTNIYIKNIPQSWNENKLKEIFSAYGKVTSMAMRLDGKNRKFGFINFEDFDEAKNAIDALNNILVDDNGILEEDEQVEEEKSKEQNGVHKEETNEEKKEKEEKGDDDNNNKDKDDNNKDKDDGNNKDKDKDDEKKEKKEKEKIRLFVCPHQSKVQRVAMLKAKYENPHNSINYDSTNYNKKNNKFQGVNLYIKNLDDTINDIELRRLFEVYGTITSAKVMRDEKGVSRGFGFVCFVSPDDAANAVTEMHLKLIYNKPLYVGLAEKREQRLAALQQRYKLVLPTHARGGGGGSGIPLSGGGIGVGSMGGIGNIGGMHGGFGNRMLLPNVQNNVVGGVIPPQMQFGVPLQHIFYGGGNSGGGGNAGAQQPNQSFSPPPRGNQVLPFQQGGGGTMPWRTQNANVYGGGGMRSQQMNAANMGMPSYPAQHNMQHAMEGGVGGGFTHPNAHMNMMMGRAGSGGGGMRMPRGGNMGGGMGGGMNNKQMGGGNQQNNVSKNMHMVDGAVGMSNNNIITPSFKFTSQARNRIESQHSAGMQQGGGGMCQLVIPQQVTLHGHGRLIGGGVSATSQQQQIGNNSNAGIDVYQGVSGGGNSDIPLTAAALAAAGPVMQKQMIGEKLFPLVARFESELAGKITGMMLEMENSELLYLIDSESQLKAKVDEALRVLQQASQEH